MALGWRVTPGMLVTPGGLWSRKCPSRPHHPVIQTDGGTKRRNLQRRERREVLHRHRRHHLEVTLMSRIVVTVRAAVVKRDMWSMKM